MSLYIPWMITSSSLVSIRTFPLKVLPLKLVSLCFKTFIFEKISFAMPTDDGTNASVVTVQQLSSNGTETFTLL